ADEAPEDVADLELAVDLDAGDRDQTASRVLELAVDDLGDVLLDQPLQALEPALVHCGEMISSWWSSSDASRHVSRMSTILSRAPFRYGTSLPAITAPSVATVQVS